MIKIREKLLDFKRRLSDRKMYSIVITVIGIISLFAIFEYRQVAGLRQKLDNQYNRAFYDMVGYVNNVDVLLLKALIAGTPNKTAMVLQEAWKQAHMAQIDLGHIPVAQPVLANTSRFLVQVGDLAYALNNKNLSGKITTDEEIKNIESLQNFASSLGESLNELQGQIASGRFKWGALEKKGKAVFQKTSKVMSVQHFENIDKTFQNYPTLIYDGAFSDHLNSLEPKVNSENEITQEIAKDRVIDFLGKERVNDVRFIGKIDETNIKVYRYEVAFKNMPKNQNVNIEITQKGGYIYWMLYDRPVNVSSMGIDEAREKGRRFLESAGFGNMVNTYYLREGNTATINFAYEQNGVIVYPDLVKVKVALDKGEVIGLESKGYLHSHEKRSIGEPKISEEQAKGQISRKLDIINTRLAIIPTEYKTEVQVYEFKCKLGDKEFLIYINSDNGNEEQILMVVNTPTGSLTI